MEKQAALIWSQLVGRELVASEGKRLTLIYPGRTNGDSGPDFRDAVIQTEGRLLQGDVEAHARSNEWYAHRHHLDAEYNNVIVHVVLWHDSDLATVLQSGKAVPVVCLAHALRHQPYLLPYRLPCASTLERMDQRVLAKLLTVAGNQRFRQKAAYFRAELKKQEPGQALFRGIMRAMGYARNTKPFEELANRVHLDYLEAQDSLARRQALLLGAAGLLPSQRKNKEFAAARGGWHLDEIWHSVGNKAEPMTERDWNLSGTYPNNSPVRRIVAVTYLLERYRERKLLAGILELVSEAPLADGHRVLEAGLTISGDSYWQEHCDFADRSRTRRALLLGRSKASEIAVNVVLPFVFAWGKATAKPELMTKTRELYDAYPKLAENEITWHMKRQLCFTEPTGFRAPHQQGLSHIFRNYCRQGRCSRCPVAGCL